MYTTENSTALYGLVAEFAEADELLAAAEKVFGEGYRKIDAYSPFPIHGLSDAIGFKDNRVPWTVFICGLIGAATGVALQYFVSVMEYPLNIGGRPLFSWPSFVPVTFECTILLSAFGAVFGMILMNGLPKPYHSIFNAPGFERATQDRFFLCIESEDPLFDRTETEKFLLTLHPERVSEVEP